MKSIVDWTGFCDTNDKPLKVSDFNKSAILREFGWILEFVEKCRKELADEVEEAEEDAEKN
jgi:hypothetical protein